MKTDQVETIIIWLGRPSRDFPSGHGLSSSTRPRRSSDFPSGPRGSSSSTRPRRSRRFVLCGPARSCRTDSARAACRRRPCLSCSPAPLPPEPRAPRPYSRLPSWLRFVHLPRPLPRSVPPMNSALRPPRTPWYRASRLCRAPQR
jgi:hypothetical protein